jgi:two-component system chemotaxis response regulator CheB
VATDISNRRDIIVLGGSAGSLEPLKILVGMLPAELNAAVFVTVHVSNEFPSALPQLMRSVGALPAFHPKDKEPIRTGSIYIAPPDFHLLLEPGRVRITRGPRENRHRPAIDPMFRTAARAYGSRVVGVILSGQLDDGAAGLLAVKMAGGLTIGQDPAEATSPEMPSRAIQYAEADHVLPAREIALLLTHVVELSPPGSRPSSESAGFVMDDSELEKPISAGGEKSNGRPSGFSCPECHGVLWELEEGELLRFRCRVGHAYTAEALRTSLSESTEEALWASLRVLEEKAALLRRMGQRSGGRTGERYHEEAYGYEEHAKTIRSVLVEMQNSSERAQVQQAEERP